MTLSERLRDLTIVNRGDLTLAYRAWDSALERPVFIKVLNPALSSDVEIRGRFDREAKAVARLDHPHLVRIYEYGHDEQLGLYMVFEWVEGRSLSDYLNERGPLGESETLELARQLLSGLSALHATGIVHRDLKPDNILVKMLGTTPDARPLFRITDFSLAAWRDAPRLTHHEAIVGTPAYMAPEQAAGGTPTPASDLFSLGVILYEAATGHNPFVGETLLATLKNVRELDVPVDHLPVSVQRLITFLLNKEPARRPRTALEALRSLEDSSVEPPSSRVRNYRYFAAAVLVVVVGILLIVFPRGSKPEPDNLTKSMSQAANQLPELRPNSQPEFRSPPESRGANHEKRENSDPVRDRAALPRGFPASSETTGSPAGKTVAESIPDSTWLTLITEPWAHVFVGDSQVGTTPLPRPLRMATGSYRFLFRNPAYPPIPLVINLSENRQKLTVRLAERVALLRAVIVPWGELYVDGEYAGTTPLSRPLFLPPGHHDLRVTHPQFSAITHEFTAAAGETLVIRADLALGEVSLRSESHDAQ